jgi:hypothetical protein
MNWYDDPLINESELAEQLNMSPQLFYMKKNNRNRNKFSAEEIKEQNIIKKRLKHKLDENSI